MSRTSVAVIGFIAGLLVQPTIGELGIRLRDSVLPNPAPIISLDLVRHDDDGIRILVSNGGKSTAIIQRLEVCRGEDIIVRDYEDLAGSGWLRYKVPEERRQFETRLMSSNSHMIASCFTKGIFPKLLSGDRELLPGRSREFLFEAIPVPMLQGTIETGMATGGGQCSLTIYGRRRIAASMLVLCNDLPDE